MQVWIDYDALERQWRKMGMKRFPHCFLIDEGDRLYLKLPKGIIGGYFWPLNLLLIKAPIAAQLAVHLYGLDEERCKAFFAAILAHESTHAHQAEQYSGIVLGLSYFPTFGVALIVNTWLAFGVGWALQSFFGLSAWVGALLGWPLLAGPVFAAALIFFIQKQYVSVWSEREAIRAQKRAEADPSWSQVVFLSFNPIAIQRDESASL